MLQNLWRWKFHLHPEGSLTSHRIYAGPLSQELKVPVVINNLGGAGGAARSDL